MSDYNGINKEESLKELRELVSLFSTNIEQYKKNQYDEANTRADFIDRFFKILGWDMYNTSGGSEKYRDVIREDKVKIEGTQKAPDYCFRFGGVRKFFVEAKKPSVNIKEAAEPAFQVRRYAYTAKLPLSILTNFEGFAIYDTRIKPHKDDKASTARINYFTFNEYEKQFEFIKSIFSKEAIYKGSFDKYIDENKNKKGTSEVDTEILALIEDWRKELAKNIAKNNKLNIFDLNTVVQRIIDRIIFLRIAEDRGIEDENLLLDISKTENIYEKLNHIFIKANLKYNSGLFTPFNWIEKVKIEDKILKNIIVNLYYPDCPYEFSVLPVEILGSIYERFLGKTIRLKAVKGDTQTAIIEEKPEVKKAGGVFYTPQYIVDYIVHNTIGEKIKDKTPDEISQIKICDPACGSGSFLVGAYKYLLDYHLDYYTQEKNIKTSLKSQKIFDAGIKNYRLTINEKQKILTNNIFGVDIDSQAVEVTKLSLYLKLLESEGKEYKEWLFKYTDNALLPSLEKNIKCGNSLISTEFYAQGNLDLDNEEGNKINCFDWDGKDGFSEIFKKGGFDVVIGNPPWVFTRDVEFGSEVKNYYKSHYLNNVSKSSRSRGNQTGKVNLYGIFVAKGVKLLNTDGTLSFIIPNTVLRTTVYEALRKYLLDNTNIKRIVDLKDGVFTGVTASTIILILELGKQIKDIEIIDNPRGINEVTTTIKKINKTVFLDNPSYSFNIFVDKYENRLFSKVKEKSIYLGEVINVYNGISTFADKQGISDTKINSTYKKILMGKDIKRYFHEWNGKYIEYVPQKLQRPRDENIFLEKEKLIMQRIAGILVTSYDDKKYYTYNSVNNILKKDNTNYSLKFILALLNSKLFQFYYIKNFTNKSSLTVNISKTFIDKLPLVKIDFNDKDDIKLHNSFVSLVDKMLELKQKENSEQNQQAKTRISRQIDGVDNAINKIVYELYGLTDEEIKIIEG